MTGNEISEYSLLVVLGLGIIGNALVILCIARQRKILKNNHYFLVLHLTICDFTTLMVYLFDRIMFQLEVLSYVYFHRGFCLFSSISHLFQVAGIAMMLVISVHRYRSVIHPLKPAIAREKLKVICCLVYLLGLIAGYGEASPSCFLHSNRTKNIYDKFNSAYVISFYYFLPTLFMSVIYFKIFRRLFQQSKYMKSVCTNAARKTSPNSSFNIVKFLRNRRTSIVCLCTVLCYAVGNIPISVWMVRKALNAEDSLIQFDFWFLPFVRLFRVASSHVVNPLIYGILDREVLAFWKVCSKTKWKTQEN